MESGQSYTAGITFHAQISLTYWRYDPLKYFSARVFVVPTLRVFLFWFHVVGKKSSVAFSLFVVTKLEPLGSSVLFPALIFSTFLLREAVLEIMSWAKLVTFWKLALATLCSNRSCSHITPSTFRRVFAVDCRLITLNVKARSSQACGR